MSKPIAIDRPERLYYFLSFHDSVFRMNCDTGQMWILGNKDLTWHPIKEENGPVKA